MNEEKLRIIEVGPKRGYGHVYPWNVVPTSTQMRFMPPDTDYKWIHAVYMKNIVNRIYTIFVEVPNGRFLPVPADHYKR